LGGFGVFAIRMTDRRCRLALAPPFFFASLNIEPTLLCTALGLCACTTDQSPSRHIPML
jgi:hypothetical protein